MRPFAAVMAMLVACQLVLAQQGSEALRILVVGGQGAKNVIQQIPPDPLVVRVEASGRPVSGAMVTFAAPSAGATGQFANGSSSTTVMTDSEGMAIVQGFHPNATTGSYQIQVLAQFRGQTAMSSIRQSNVESLKGHGKLITILAIAGAAAGAAAIAKSGHGSSSSGPTVTFGDSAVGAPKP